VRKLQWAGVTTATVLLAAGMILACLGDSPRRSGVPLLLPHHPIESWYKGGPFRVGVLGDSQKGLANLRNATSRVLGEDILFLLQTGDWVSNNDLGHYWLAAEFMQRGGAKFIPYIAPGNHDVKGGTKLFEAWCGSLERSFSVGDVAFVLINNAFGNPIPPSRHIEERIAAAGPHKAVVLAMHQPPFDAQGNAKPEYGEFLAWLEKRKVAYLLCGHVHAYLRKKVGETTVIINGVGGDYDKWQLDQKVYATILDVDGTKIADRRIELEPVHEVWENIQHFAIGHFAESYRQKPILCWLGTVLLAGAVGWGWGRLLRRPKIPQAA
jgi:Icc-related predicted phosphoesterase